MATKVTEELEKLLDSATKLEIPAQVRAMALESVEKAREANAKWNVAAAEGASLLEEAVMASQTGMKALADKIVSNSVSNIESAFDAAQKLSRAKSVAEAAQIQAQFAKDQVAAVQEQSKALLEISQRIAKEANDKLVAISAKAVESLKKTT